MILTHIAQLTLKNQISSLPGLITKAINDSATSING